MGKVTRQWGEPVKKEVGGPYSILFGANLVKKKQVKNDLPSPMDLSPEEIGRILDEYLPRKRPWWQFWSRRDEF